MPLLYSKILTDKLDLSYIKKSSNIKKKLKENIKSQGTLFILLDAWASINQKAFLGIII
jgi:hypothetical protein